MAEKEKKSDEDAKCTIYVSNVAASLPADAIRQFFSYCGSIKSLKVLGYVASVLCYVHN